MNSPAQVRDYLKEYLQKLEWLQKEAIGMSQCIIDLSAQETFDLRRYIGGMEVVIKKLKEITSGTE